MITLQTVITWLLLTTLHPVGTLLDYVDEAGKQDSGSLTYRINNSTETITA